MTPEETKRHSELKTEIQRVKKELREIEAHLWSLKYQCLPHNPVANKTGGVVCDTCGQHLGWYCPDSHDHCCHYEQEDGSIDEDCCRYCGQPEERK